MSLPLVVIKRDFDNDLTGPTFGRLKAPGGFECDTLERPATGTDHLRIPAGSYKVHASQHPEHGLCYEIQNVPGRTGILFHPANWIRELLGCIALGRSVMVVEGDYKGQHVKEIGVSSSRDACQAFWDHMGGQDFMLTIG